MLPDANNLHGHGEGNKVTAFRTSTHKDPCDGIAPVVGHEWFKQGTTTTEDGCNQQAVSSAKFVREDTKDKTANAQANHEAIVNHGDPDLLVDITEHGELSYKGAVHDESILVMGKAGGGATLQNIRRELLRASSIVQNEWFIISAEVRLVWAEFSASLV